MPPTPASTPHTPEPSGRAPKHRRRRKPTVIVRQTEPKDFPGITALSRLVYPHEPPWEPVQLTSHLRVFPQGQFVAEDIEKNEIVGMTASLIVDWDDYDFSTSYLDFTDHFMFTNHNPSGRTLYAAEVMTHPARRGQGIGKKLYAARRQLVRDLGLLRIRAGARLRGYGQYADTLTPEQYVIKVINRELADPTLTFQLRQGFRVLAVIHNYLREDPESQGAAAVIEWINHRVAARRDYRRRDPRFARKRRRSHEQ